MFGEHSASHLRYLLCSKLALQVLVRVGFARWRHLTFVAPWLASRALRRCQESAVKGNDGCFHQLVLVLRESQIPGYRYHPSMSEVTDCFTCLAIVRRSQLIVAHARVSFLTDLSQNILFRMLWVKGKGKGQVLDIALLHDEHILRSALQSRKWEVTGMS